MQALQWTGKNRIWQVCFHRFLAQINNEYTREITSLNAGGYYTGIYEARLEVEIMGLLWVVRVQESHIFFAFSLSMMNGFTVI